MHPSLRAGGPIGSQVRFAGNPFGALPAKYRVLRPRRKGFDVKKLLSAVVPALALVALAAAAASGRPVATSADLSVANAASASSVHVGANVTFTIVATNQGPDPATQAKVTDTLPASLGFVSASSSVGTCSGTKKVVCSLGTLGSAASATVTLVARVNQAGPIADTAKVVSATPDPNTANNASKATTSGFIAVVDNAFDPQNALTKVGAKVPWHFTGSFPHTVTDNTGLNLYDSGTKSPGASYSFTYKAAGTYGYICTIHGFTGIIRLAPTVSPTSGPQGSPFTIKWASAAPPSGDVFDVQVMVPGGAFVAWMTGVTTTSGTYVPSAGPGNYAFRARLRNPTTLAATAYSPGAVIKVT
jgi:uncharacterized repeat protein (TIGR01451 family)